MSPMLVSVILSMWVFQCTTGLQAYTSLVALTTPADYAELTNDMQATLLYSNAHS